MGSGCFKPVSSKGQIDIKTLQNMYEDIKQIYLPDSNNPYQTIQIYSIIKQKIMKKGQLKKLIDYLSSHRFRICDNLLHNFRIITQSKTIHNKYVCLIMINQLFSSLQQIPKCTQFKDTIKSIHQQSLSFSIKQMKKLTNTSQISNGINLKKNEKQVQIQSTSMMLYQITSYKFQSIYFNIVYHLLQYDNQIYKLTLQNMNKYCNLGKVFFNNQKQIEQIMKILQYRIQVNDYLVETIATYSILLQRVKGSFFNKNISSLRQFIIVWLNNQIQQQQLIQQNLAYKQKILYNCQQIIQNFIKKQIQGWNSNIIFQIILQLLDEEYFKTVKKIQILILKVTQCIDLKHQFYRGLFLYLLAYTSIPQNQQLQKVWQSIYPSQNYQTMKKKYSNILQHTTKLNSLNCINKWIFDHKFVDIYDVIQYSSLCLVYAFVFNLLLTNTQIKDKTIIQYIYLYKKLRRKQRIIILDITLQQILQNFMTDQQIFIILSICQKFIQKQSFLQLSQNYSHTIPSLTIKYKFQNNIKIIQLVTNIVNKLSVSYFYCQLQNLCLFMYSFYVQIKQGLSTISQKLMLIQLFKIYVQILKKKNQSNIVIAFIKKIQNQKQNSFYTFYHDIIIYELLQIIQSTIKYPHNLKEIKNKIKNNCQVDKINLLQTYVGTQLKVQIVIKQRDDNYLATVNLFRKIFSREQQYITTTSFFIQIHSIMSGCSIGDAKQGKQLDDIIDILNNNNK